MSLKYTTLLSINIVALIFLGVIMFSTNQVIHRSFQDLEKSTVLGKLERLHDALDAKHEELATITRDWALWDDCWEFAQRPNDRFVVSNFSTNIFTNYDINLAAVLSLGNSFVYKGYYSDGAEEIVTLPNELARVISGEFPEFHNLSESDTYKALLDTELGPLMLVAIPILKSDGTGPIAGYLIMARIVTEDHIVNLQGFKNIDVKATYITAKTPLNSSIKEIVAKDGVQNHVSFLGKNTISAMDAIRSIDGKAQFVVEIQTSMEATNIGKGMRNLILMLYVLVAIIQSILLRNYLSRKVIDRLLLVQEQVKNVTLNPEKQGAVECPGKDELTDLAKNINLMLLSLHNTQAELMKAKDKAEESDRLKSAFLATMNHELRTPLNHILGFCQLLSNTEDPKDIRRYTQNIFQSGTTLLKMIQDLFNLVIAERGELRPDLVTTQCFDHFFHNKTVLEEMLNEAEKQNNITLVFKPDKAALMKNITLDVDKVNQILKNLFSNAVKYTNSGSIEFGFQISSSSSILYYVKDTGIGIPKDKHDIVFDLFRQVDESKSRAYGGMGIGLAVSAKICEAISAKLNMESAEEQGTTMYLDIPCTYHDSVKQAKIADAAAVPDLENRKILILEKDETAVMIISSMLKNTHATILKADSCQKAKDIIQDHPELLAILADLKLKDETGTFCWEMVKRQHPEIPILGLCDSGTSVMEDAAKQLACALEKPINKQKLYQTLKELI